MCLFFRFSDHKITALSFIVSSRWDFILLFSLGIFWFVISNDCLWITLFNCQLFEKVEVTKPVASRSTSAEIYVVGLRYKAPARIDPRLLDFKHLFQGAINPPKVIHLILICCANSFINAFFFFFFPLHFLALSFPLLFSFW